MASRDKLKNYAERQKLKADKQTLANQQRGLNSQVSRYENAVKQYQQANPTPSTPEEALEQAALARINGEQVSPATDTQPSKTSIPAPTLASKAKQIAGLAGDENIDYSKNTLKDRDDEFVSRIVDDVYKRMNTGEKVDMKRVQHSSLDTQMAESLPDFMTEEETNGLIQAYNNYGSEGARSYWEKVLYPVLSERQAAHTEEGAKKFADEYPVLSNITSVGMNTVGAVAAAADQIPRILAGQGSDVNLGSAQFFNAGKSIREETAEKIAEEYDLNIGSVNIPSLLYQAGMSMADMITAAGISGGNTVGIQIIMSSAAGMSTLIDAKKEGISDARAISRAVVSGLVEWITEKYSLEVVMKPVVDSSLKSSLLQLLKSFVAEGSEEVAADVLNDLYNIVDNLSHEDEQEWQTYINDYLTNNPGASEEDARLYALEQYVAKFSSSFVAGGAAGAALGSVNIGQQHINTRRTGSTIINGNAVQGAVTDARTTAEETGNAKLMKLAENISNKSEAGKKVDAFRLGRLIEESATEQSNFNMEQFIERRMKEISEEAGVSEKQAKLQAVAEYKGMMGEELSRQQKKMLDKASDTEEKADALVESVKSAANDTMVKTGTENTVAALRQNAYDKSRTVDVVGSKESVTISKVASFAKDGTVIFETTDGKTISSKNLHISENPVMAQMINYAKTLGLSVDATNEIINGYDGSGVGNYLGGFMEYYTEGVKDSSADFGKALEKIGTKNVSAKVAKAAYEAGFKNHEAYVKSRENGKYAGKKLGASGKSYLDTSRIDMSKLTAKQREQVEAVDIIANALGINVHLYAAKSENGKYTEESGAYRKGHVYVDIFSGVNETATAEEARHYAIVKTLSHEITHYIAAASPRSYAELQSFVMDKLGTRNVEALIASKRSDPAYENFTYDEMLEEITADACETMIFDSKTVQEFVNQHSSASKNIFAKIKELFRKLKAAITGQQSFATNVLSESAETMRKLQELWDKALNSALTHQQTAESAGIVMDGETNTMFSQRYSTASDNLAGVSRDDLLVSIMTLTGRSEAEVESYLRAEEVAALAVKGSDIDFVGNDKEVAIKNNSDYPQGTIDLVNICPKRLPVTAITNRLQEALPNDLFTADDYADIRLILMNDGRVVACGLCFVEDRRQHIGEIAQDFINEWNKAIASGTNLKRVNSAGKTVDVKIGKDLAARYGVEGGLVSVRKAKMAQDTFMSSTKWSRLQSSDPYLAAAFEAFNNARRQSAGRLMLDRAEYKREILTWDAAHVKRVNDAGGLRIFSFSDFETIHLLDLLQIIEDCAARGVKIQGYTKQTAFAKLVSGTGIKLNRSFIPYGATGVKTVNGVRVLSIDTVEGMNNEDANFLDETNNPNVGNNITGINDEQIHLAMTDPFFHYIIPFHSNKAQDSNNKLGVGKWFNYKPYQTDKQASSLADIRKAALMAKQNRESGMSDTEAYQKALNDAEKQGIKFAALKEDKMVNIYTDVLTDSSVVDAKTFVQKYLDVCASRNIVPRFAQFLNVDENGNFTDADGYYKFLVDFKLFDNDGKLLPQGLVTPTFDSEFIQQLIKDELAKSESERAGDVYPEELYNDVLNYIKVKHGHRGNISLYNKYSNIVNKQVSQVNSDDEGTGTFTYSPTMRESRDSNGRVLSEGQAQYFADSKVRDENGNLLVVYHGTDESFTEFDPNGAYLRWYEDLYNSMPYEMRQGKVKPSEKEAKIGFNWAARDEEYSEKFGSDYTMVGYVNITNPLDIGEIEGYGNYDNAIQKLSEITGINVEELERMDEGSLFSGNIYEITRTKKFMDAIVAKGYDGVFARENGNRTFGFANSSQFKNIDNENPSEDSDVRYEIREDVSDKIDRALTDNRYSDLVILSDNTPSIITSQKGTRNLPIGIRASHIRSNILTEEEANRANVSGDGTYHGLGKQLFMMIIDSLEDVDYAFRGTRNANNPSRRENYFLLVPRITDAEGNKIIVPVYIYNDGDKNYIAIRANRIATVFGKDEAMNYIRKEVSNQNLVRIRNKKGSQSSSELTGPIPARYVKTATTGESAVVTNTDNAARFRGSSPSMIVPQLDGPVNTSGEDFSTNDQKMSETRRYATVASQADFSTPVDKNTFGRILNEENDISNFIPKTILDRFTNEFTHGSAIDRKGIFTKPRLYRGMEKAELDNILANGYVHSNGSYNFESQQGQTLLDEDARYATSYATGYAPTEIRDKHYEQGVPSYVIEVANTLDLDATKNDSGETYTYTDIPAENITRIFEITYDKSTNKDMVRDVTAEIADEYPDLGIGSLKNVSAHGRPMFYRDRTSNALLYRVQGEYGYETDKFISEMSPEITVDFNKINEDTSGGIRDFYRSKLGIYGDSQNFNLRPATIEEILSEDKDGTMAETRRKENPRTILANALDSIAKTEADKKLLADYKDRVKQFNRIEQNIAKSQELINSGELSEEDAAEEQKKIDNRLAALANVDKGLLKLESTSFLQNVLAQERVRQDRETSKRVSAEYGQKMVAQAEAFRQKAKAERLKRKGTELKHQIAKMAADFDKAFARPTETNYVPKDMQVAVSTILSSINTDTSNATARIESIMADINYRNERIADAKTRLANAKTDKQRAFYTARIKSHEAALAKLTLNLATQQKRQKAFQDSIDAIQKRYAAYLSEHYENNVTEEEDGTALLIKQMVEAIGNTPISMMDYDQLSTVYMAMSALKKDIFAEKSNFRNQKMETIKDYADRMEDELHKYGNRKPLGDKKNLGKKIALWQMSPRTVFHWLGNYDEDSVFYQMYRELDEGQMKSSQDMMEGMRMFTDIIEGDNRENMEKLHAHKKDDLVFSGFYDVNGNKVMITRGMRISLYLALNDEDNARHILCGGMNVPEFNLYYGGVYGNRSVSYSFRGTNNQTTRVRANLRNIAEVNKKIEEQRKLVKDLYNQANTEKGEAKIPVYSKIADEEKALDGLVKTREDLIAQIGVEAQERRAELYNAMTPWEREFADTSAKFFNGFAKDKVNEATMKLFNFDKATKENYFPIVVDPTTLDTGVTQTVKPSTSLTSAGIIQDRTVSSSAINLFDITDVLQKHMATVSDINGMMYPLEIISKAMNFKYSSSASVKGSMDKYAGAGVTDNVMHLLQNLAGTYNHRDSSFMDKFWSNYVGATFAMNFSIVLKQAASYPAASVVVGHTALAKGLTKAGRSDAETLKLVSKYSPLLWLRTAGYASDELRTVSSKKDLLTTRKGIRKVLNMIQAMDMKTVSTLWYASEYYVDEKYPNLKKGTEEYYRKVAEVFNRCVEETQPNYTTLQRPEAIRDTAGILRFLTAFKTQPMQNANILADAMLEYGSLKKQQKNGVNISDARLEQAKTKVVSAVTSQMVGMAMMSFIQMAINAFRKPGSAFRDKDGDITAWSILQEFLKGFLDSGFGTFIGFGELWNVISACFDWSTFYGWEDMGVAAFSDFGQSFINLVKGLKNGNLTWAKVKNFVSDFGNLVGIPAHNIIRLWQTISNWFEMLFE